MKNKVLNFDKSNWKLTRLGDLLKDISKRVDNPKQSGYDRFVGLEHFISGDIKIRNWGTTENLASSTKAFKAGDILFARRNAYLRRASLVDFDGCCSGDAFVLRENHDMVVPGFMAFFMNSNDIWDFANENAAGTMSQRVKWRDLAKYEFLLPPKDQQAKLAELLWTMDEVIEMAKQLTKSIMNTKRCFFKVFRSSAHYKPLSEFSKVSYGLGQPPAKDEDGVSMIRATDISKGRIDKKNFLRISERGIPKERNVKLVEGDIIIVRSGAYTGDLAMVTKDCEGTIAGYDLVIRPNRDRVNPIWLQEYLLEKEAQYYFKGESIRSAQPHLNSQQVLDTLIPEYSISIQNQASNILALFHNNVLNSEEKISRSIDLQKSIINQIFSNGIQ